MGGDGETWTVRVSPSSENTRVKEEYGELRVRLTAPAEDGKANQELIHVLADYFNIDETQVEIIRGHTSQKKIVVVSGQVKQ